MTSINTMQNHIKANITSWLNNLYYEFAADKKKNYNREEKAKNKEEIIDICNVIFNKIYKDDYLFTPEAYNDFLKGKDECAYCHTSNNLLKAFYNHVQSDRYQRGLSLEVDRKVGRMKDYLNDSDREEFIKNVDICLRGISNKYTTFNEALKWLKALKKSRVYIKKYHDELLYLPAPYNESNCVLACYWCNNAKTDAFTDKEFEPIGLIIGDTIRSILTKKKGNT